MPSQRVTKIRRLGAPSRRVPGIGNTLRAGMTKLRKLKGTSGDENSTAHLSVAQIETAIPAFIGFTENAEDNGADLRNTPTSITSLMEFESLFGKGRGIDLVIVDDTHAVQKIRIENEHFYLHDSLSLFFDNGGRRCLVVSIGLFRDITVDNPMTISDFQNGLQAIKNVGEITLILFPDAVNLDDAALGSLQHDALRQCEELGNRFAVFDTKCADQGDILAIIDAFRNHVAGCLKYGAAYAPWLALIRKLDTRGLDAKIVDTAGDLIENIKNAPSYPAIVREVLSQSLICPPSGALAGIYDYVDKTRGVWKSPANVAISGVSGPVYLLNKDESDSLTIDDHGGKSINPIRFFTRRGTQVWGARTLAGNDNEWRYICVRRFFDMVEKSIKQSTMWAVFEPNDAVTWVKVKGMIENFLILQWRNGALQGDKPDHAFFVLVGLGVTMTAADILEGRMIIKIGMAMIRPTEFSILTISHKMISPSYLAENPEG